MQNARQKKNKSSEEFLISPPQGLTSNYRSGKNIEAARLLYVKKLP
jgi:hypothetical protein